MNTGSEKQRDRDEKVVEIEIERLHDFKNHPDGRSDGIFGCR